MWVSTVLSSKNIPIVFWSKISSCIHHRWNLCLLGFLQLGRFPLFFRWIKLVVHGVPIFGINFHVFFTNISGWPGLFNHELGFFGCSITEIDIRRVIFNKGSLYNSHIWPQNSYWVPVTKDCLARVPYNGISIAWTFRGWNHLPRFFNNEKDFQSFLNRCFFNLFYHQGEKVFMGFSSFKIAVHGFSLIEFFETFYPWRQSVHKECFTPTKSVSIAFHQWKRFLLEIRATKIFSRTQHW